MMNAPAPFPENIADISQLDDLLSAPTDRVIETVRKREGDFLILGAAGKMGPTLSRMLRRAIDALGRKNRVTPPSRSPPPGAGDEFRRHDIETIQADLLDPQQLDALPDAPN